jgi:hypothetical protein
MAVPRHSLRVLTGALAMNALVMGALILPLLAVACVSGAGERAAVTRAEQPDPGQILERSRAAMSALLSYRFGGEWVLQEGQETQRWERSGEWAAPDRLRLRFDAPEGATLRGQVLVVMGQDAYFRPAGRHDWVEIDVSPSLKSDASGAAIPDMTDVRFADGPAPDAAGMYHLVGRAPGPARPQDVRAGGYDPGGIAYRLTVRSSDFLPVELVAETRLARAGPAEATLAGRSPTQRLVVRFYDFDAPVSIDMPAPVRQTGESGYGQASRGSGPANGR